MTTIRQLALETAKILDNLIKVVTDLNKIGNFGTAQIAQTAVQNAASLADRCAEEAEAEAEAGKALKTDSE